MSVLLNTNLLTRLIQVGHPHHVPAGGAINILQHRGEIMCVVPQNLYEFWTVCTRPVSPENGLGLSVPEAQSELARIHALFAFLPDSPAVYTEWQRLVTTYEIKGKPSHDVRLVAAMKVHGIQQILTFNDRDFVQFSDIQVITPEKVMAS